MLDMALGCVITLLNLFGNKNHQNIKDKDGYCKAYEKSDDPLLWWLVLLHDDRVVEENGEVE